MSHALSRLEEWGHQVGRRGKTEEQLPPAVTQWVAEALGRLTLTAALAMGLLILLGGENRFSGQSYATALTYPGAPESWGYVVGAMGVVGLVCSLLGWLRGARWSLLGIAAWAFFFAYSILQTAMDDERSGTTGIVVYTYLGITSIVLAVAHRR